MRMFAVRRQERRLSSKQFATSVSARLYQLPLFQAGCATGFQFCFSQAVSATPPHPYGWGLGGRGSGVNPSPPPPPLRHQPAMPHNIEFASICLNMSTTPGGLRPPPPPGGVRAGSSDVRHATRYRHPTQPPFKAPVNLALSVLSRT
jgi:hypothetical protein